MEESLNLVPPSNSVVFPDRVVEANGKGRAGVGLVNVTRSAPDPQEGFTWNITYTTAIGNIDQVTVKSYLLGLQATIAVATTVQGNEIGGTFQLEFQGMRTRPIHAAESAQGLAQKLEELPMVSTAYASRIDPTENCDDGFCPNGPFPSRSMLWTVYVTTDLNYDDVTPTSPTSPQIYEQGPFWRVTAHYDSLTGINATATVYQTTTKSLERPNDLLNISFPFSLAFGGGGGSYGGYGGRGYGINPVGALYGDRTIPDLLGGSGGSMRTGNPFEINSVLGPVNGRGGHGGGAIELVAANDLTIGTYGRIIMRGGDGEQTSGGGGGGGSGGAILLTSGTIIFMAGELDVTGGRGGFGGPLTQDLAGGGGGGGRIAYYGESITINGVNSYAGGACGTLKATVERNVVVLNTSVYMIMLSPLDDERLAYLGTEFVKMALNPAFVYFSSIQQQLGPNSTFASTNNTIHALLELSVQLYYEGIVPNISHVNNRTFHNNTKAYQAQLDEFAGFNFAQVIMAEATVNSFGYMKIYPTEAISKTCDNPGSDGTLYTEAKATSKMYVAKTNGAESTSRALFLSNRETTNTTSGSGREAPFSANGPIVPFEASRPSRITYYTRSDAVPSESLKTDYGTLFALISRGESGLNVSNVIGVYFGSKIMHGANFGSAVDEKVFLKRLVSIDNYPILSRWYKIDIKIQWVNHTYSVTIDDLIVTTAQTFVGDDVDGIRLSVYRSVDVWFDEIYIGFDNSLDFQCPITLRTGTSTQAPVQRHWSYEEVHGEGNLGYTAYNKMTRHYNWRLPSHPGKDPRRRAGVPD
jgi:hypothetical protein